MTAIAVTKHNKNSGYLGEITYPDKFYRELSPVFLNYVAAIGGAYPRNLATHFTYLDLGCGSAQSTIINAGAFPQAEFHACDFNPAHIEMGRRYAIRMGVTNVQFHETYFENLLEIDLPPFDFIVIHGIYSWVGMAVRQTIQRIISKKLKAGGLLYLSYNCLPGWSPEAPLRKLLLEFSATINGDINQRTQQALSMLKQMSTSGIHYFKENPSVIRTVESFANDPANYLAHEFFNETWALFYSIDIADEMAKAGATYLGSATLADNHPMLVIDKQAARSVAQLPTRRLQQLALDFAVNQRFRRDVFVGGGRLQRTQGQNMQDLDDAIIGCVGDLEQISTTALIPRGKISFQEDFIGDLKLLMQHGPASIGDTVTALAGKDRNAIEIKQNLIFLVAAGTLLPCAKAQQQNRRMQNRMPNKIIENALIHIANSGIQAFVPSEQVGNGVLIQVHEAWAVKNWLAGHGPCASLSPRLFRIGILE